MSNGLELVPKKAYEQFERVLKNLNLQDRAVILESVSMTKVNYLSFVVRARVHGEHAPSFILKCTLNDADVNKFFEREIYSYQKVLSELRKLEVEATDNFYPECFDSSSEFNSEFLILEDLASRGFKGIDHLELLDYHHIVVALKEYARLHALGFALRDQKKQIFDDLAKNVGENVFSNSSHETRCVCSDACNRVLDCFDYNKEPALFIALVKTFIDAPNIVNETFCKQLNSQYSVFTHVDCRLGNLLFKYNEYGGVTNACLVDWQLLTLASPAIDLLYAILINTDKDLRDKRFEELISEYYASFCDYLRKLGSDPDRLFPFETLRKHIKIYGANSLLLASATLHTLFNVSDETPRDDNNFQKRMKGIVEDCCSFGILRVDQ